MTEAPTSGLGGRLETDDLQLPGTAALQAELDRLYSVERRAEDVSELARVIKAADAAFVTAGLGRLTIARRDAFAQALSQFLLGSASNAPPEPPANT